jgi:hypothetical protein
VNLHDRERWSRALTTAGWLLTGSYLLLLVAQIRRTMQVRESSFPDGVWGQRAETIAFIALPQNLVMLVPAAAAAILAAWLLTTEDRLPLPWTRRLVRVVAGLGYVVILLAAVGIIDEFAQAPDAIGGAFNLMNRIGGILVSAAVIRVCVEVDGPR